MERIIRRQANEHCLRSPLSQTQSKMEQRINPNDFAFDAKLTIDLSAQRTQDNTLSKEERENARDR